LAKPAQTGADSPAGYGNFLAAMTVLLAMARRWIVVVLAGSLLAACGQDRDPAGAPPNSSVP
jgi:hypothetical protein